MIPFYVGGRGKVTRASTKDFKVAIFELLESTGLGYVIRSRYYDDSIRNIENGNVSGYLVLSPPVREMTWKTASANLRKDHWEKVAA